MILFHGSAVSGIECLRPFQSSQDKPYVYLTQSEVLAAIYSCNPLTRPNGYFTYWWDRDGKLYYDEYFENQTEVIYSGQKGFVYRCEGDYQQMEKMPWVYLSAESVPVMSCKEIADIYQQLLKYESEGMLTIRRWNEASDKQKEIWERVVKRSFDNRDMTLPINQQYYRFIKEHFNNIEI